MLLLEEVIDDVLAEIGYSIAQAKKISNVPDLDPKLYLDPIRFKDEINLLEHCMDCNSDQIQYDENFEDPKKYLSGDGWSQFFLAKHRTEQKFYRIREVSTDCYNMKTIREMEADFAVRVKIEHPCVLKTVGHYQTLTSMNIVEENCSEYGSLDRIFSI